MTTPIGWSSSEGIDLEWLTLWGAAGLVNALPIALVWPNGRKLPSFDKTGAEGAVLNEVNTNIENKLKKLREFQPCMLDVALPFDLPNSFT